MTWLGLTDFGMFAQASAARDAGARAPLRWCTQYLPVHWVCSPLDSLDLNNKYFGATRGDLEGFDLYF